MDREKPELQWIGLQFQIKKAFAGISADDAKKVVVAYEPIWAIGTGKNRNGRPGGRSLRRNKKAFADLYDEKNRKRDYYSVRRHERKELCGLLSKPNIDGGLIGGASLKSADFAVITSAAK